MWMFLLILYRATQVVITKRILGTYDIIGKSHELHYFFKNTKIFFTVLWHH